MSIAHGHDVLPAAPSPSRSNQEGHTAQKLKEWWTRRRALTALASLAGAGAIAATVLSPHVEAIDGTAMAAPGHSAEPKPGVGPAAPETSTPAKTEKGLQPADANLCNAIKLTDLNRWLHLGISQDMAEHIEVNCIGESARQGKVAYGEWQPDPNSALSQYSSISIAVDRDKATDGTSNLAAMMQQEPRNTTAYITTEQNGAIYSAVAFLHENKVVVKIPDTEDGDKLLSLSITPQEGFGSSHEVRDAIVQSELGALPHAIPGVFPELVHG